jgi:simple sugar transport system permease protein
VFEGVLIPLGAILAALVLFGVFCYFQGQDPFKVYASIYKASFGSWFAFQNTLMRTAPLMLTALCTAIPARLGMIIIGNEGALVMGGIGAVLAGLAVAAWPPYLALTAMALSGMIWGGLWITFAGAIRQYRGVNETICTLLLNYISIAVLNHLVNGPMKDPASLNKPSSFPIPEANMLGRITWGDFTMRVHWGLVFGLVACLVLWFLMQRTTFGFQARFIGANPKAARLGGLPVNRIILISCFLAGACAGLAGMVEVAAVHGRANESLAAGFGYAGILVAFVARFNPLAVVPVSLLLGGILASSGILQRAHKLPDSTSLVFQGLVFLVILFADTLYGRFKIFKS